MPQSQLQVAGPRPLPIDEKQLRRAQIAASHTASTSPQPAATHPPATSVLMQGNPKTATKTLFLFPDGSGSAASYRQMPHISTSTVVYGLNCPYLRNPSAWTCGPQDLTPSYIAEIRRRQPTGPYYLGGYSTGGILAYDAAQVLVEEGEQIEKLILIDSPCPIHIKPLPSRLMDFLKAHHIFSGGAAQERDPPSWLYPHFSANTDALQKYRVRPFEPYHEPSTYIIYAGRGVLEDEDDEGFEVGEEDPKEMKWIMSKREDFSAMGWEKLLNEDDLRIEVLDVCHHFSMMRGESARSLAEAIGRAMA